MNDFRRISTNLYRKISKLSLVAGGCFVAPYSGLEPYLSKDCSAVLRGKGGSDPAGLPGSAPCYGNSK
jgi:hypothetical protein